MRSSIINGGASKEYKRHASDLYSTPKECTYALVDFLVPNNIIHTSEVIWECASGEDAILDALLTKGFIQQIGSDLSMGTDYLTSAKMAEIVISNPPFNLAVEFIEKSISLDLKMFVFLLKSHYWQAATRLELFNRSKPAYHLPLTWRPVFVPTRGKQPTMEFSWFVWIKDWDKPTQYIPLPKPK